MKNRFAPYPGMIVKSNFRAAWTGVVVSVDNYPNSDYFRCKVVLVFTPSGAAQPKGKTMILSSHWLRERTNLTEKQISILKAKYKSHEKISSKI